MKQLIFLLLMTLTLNVTAQDVWFVQTGIDPAILSGSNFLSDGKRVGSGGIDYIVQIGRENFENGKIGFKFGAQWEQFKKINYTSYGFFGGVTFDAPRIPLTELYLGHFWYLTAEVNLIDRKGIKDSRIFNADTYTAWGLGANLGIRFNRPDLWAFRIPFNAEILVNCKDRPDIRVHYTGGKFDSLNDIKISGYLLLTFNF